MTTIVFGWIIIICYLFGKYKLKIITNNSNSLDIFNNCIVSRFFPIITIAILVGLRYNVGVDYPVYKEIYENDISSDITWSLAHSGVEWLFTTICAILHKVNMPYYGMFVVMTIIPLAFYYSSFDDKRYLLIPATFFLFASGVFFWYMNIMRQGISFFILLFAVKYIIKKSFVKYILCIIIASGFHRSALLFVPMYVLYYIRHAILPRNIAIVTYIITWILSKQLISLLLNLATPFLGGTYVKYLNVLEIWEMGGGTGLGVLALHISDIMLIYLSSLCLKYFKKERFDIYYNLFLGGAFISNIAGLNMLLSRIPFCFISMRIIVAAFIAYLVYKKWKNVSSQYRIAASIMLLCNMAYFTGNLINLEYQFVEL